MGDFSVEGLFWAALTPLEVGWVLVAGVYILLQRRSPQATLAWIFALAFMPVFGLLIYFFFGPRRFERRKQRRALARRAVHRGQREDTFVHQVSDQTRRWMTLCEAAVGRAGRPRPAEVTIFFDGRELYDRLVETIRSAASHVHLEYYIWEPDAVGQRLRDVLVERAKAGVEVRVLVDGWGSPKSHEGFFAPLCAAGGRVRRFNALTWARWRPRMANFRTHRKIAVIDGTTAFTGGMNLSELHSSEFVGNAAWRDTHLALCGPAVKGLQMVFFEDWHYAGGDGPNIQGYLEAPSPARDDAPLVQVVSSGPDENLDAIHKLYFAAISEAAERVWLTTPYFVPDAPIVQALTVASLRGADVRLLLPAKGDVPIVAAAARSYYPELLEAGVRIFEFGPPVLHAKTLVVDGQLGVVGTANCDNRSFRLNFEVVVAMYDATLVLPLANQFEVDLEAATEVTLEALQSVSLPRRLGSSAARLLSPIL